jgi:TPR repeat protein
LKKLFLYILIALVNLASCYENGVGCALNEEQAFQLYLQAAIEQKIPVGIYK